jgi:hypothetical protein
VMKFSAAEASAAKTTAEGVCMENSTEAAAMESTTAPSQRFVVGKHQDRSEQCTGRNRQKLFFI